MANDALAPALRFVSAFVAAAYVPAHLPSLRDAFLDQLIPAAVGRPHGAILFHHNAALSGTHFGADAAILFDTVRFFLCFRRVLLCRLSGKCTAGEPEQNQDQ
ncbi:MAG: hypothetical protein AAGB04_20855 [Pseudomonadota bacterium]